MPDSAIQVRPHPLDSPRDWNAYVFRHYRGTVFHRMEWSQAVFAAYGHQPMHLAAWSQGNLCGLLPLFLVRSRFVGKVLVSVPYGTYGGVLADDDQIARAILDRAVELREQCGAKYLELRNREESGFSLPEITRYDTFRKALPLRSADVLPGLPRKARAAARNGLSALGENSVSIGAELLGEIYALYCRALRRLGSPNYSWPFFRELARSFGDDCVCLLVRDRGKAVAGVVSYIYQDEIVPSFSGCTERGMRKNANNVMYLRLMEYAIDRGLRWFDFNRTRRDNHGPYDFKRHHGFEPAPLHYQIALSPGAEMPNLTPSNRKFALAGKVWRRLPLCITRAAGAYVSRWIP